MTILREIVRGTVEWIDDEQTRLTVPTSVPELDIDSFAVPDHVEGYERKRRELRADRREYFTAFDDLDQAVIGAVY